MNYQKQLNTHIYNKWVFSADESSNSLQVYRNEGFFEDAEVEMQRPQRWRFAAHSDVFVNSPYPKNNLKRPPRRCPTGGHQTTYVPSRTKGKWELIDENGVTSLLLHYYRAEKGKAFQLAKTVRYLVVHLEEDLMELVMINGSDAM